MNVFKIASMVRAHLQYRLSKPLVKTIWEKQNVNSSLEIISALHVHHQGYHTTPIFLKKKMTLSKLITTVKIDDKLLSDFTARPTTKKSTRIVNVWDRMTIKDLSISINRDLHDILDVIFILNKRKVYDENFILTPESFIFKIVHKLGYKANIISASSQKQKVEPKLEDRVKRPPPDECQLQRRHPVVTIMGHVDHGKTTLLDALRNTSVVESEFGGITQHIGAFDVTLKSGERVTFLDTPGHAAFKTMRYRGAYVTDIIVLVVAADDGVKDQTLQSIEIAKEAKVPVIIAINKIDKPNIDIEKTLRELATHGIVVEDLGGDVQCIKVSALQGMNMGDLTEAIVLQAELMNLKADFNGLVEGVILDCRNDIGRGKLVTALIQRGTLRKGNFLVSGLASAKVRSMFNDCGSPILEAKPADAVQIIGWKALPNVGDEILEVENDKIMNEVLKFREKALAKSVAIEHRAIADKKNEAYVTEYRRLLSFKQVYGRNFLVNRVVYKKQIEDEKRMRVAAKSETPTVNVIIKGDVGGSVETLLDVFDTYTYNNICHLSVIHYGVGPITHSDLDVAELFNAIIYGFNISSTKEIQEKARNKGIAVRNFNVIYELIDDIKQEITSILPIIDIEEMLGEAVVLQHFDIRDGKKKVSVAGCRCVKGLLLKSEMYHVMRNGEDIYTGKLVSMKHVKNEVMSIEVNLECGLRFEDPSISFQPGDTIVCFQVVKKQQEIHWNPGF